jgi:hypothetical protein
MAPHDLIFIVGVLVLALFELVTALVALRDRPERASRRGAASEHRRRRFEEGVESA